MLEAWFLAWMIARPAPPAPPRHSMLGRDRIARPPDAAEEDWERGVRREIERIFAAGGDPFH